MKKRTGNIYKKIEFYTKSNNSDDIKMIFI